MSIYQCVKCGCLENTACSTGSRPYSYNMQLEREPDDLALLSYKKILGLRLEEPFEEYCSACTPFWFTKEGDYGLGPYDKSLANKSDKCGGWHGDWARMFLPKKQFHTGEGGNLTHTASGTQDICHWKRSEEYSDDYEIPKTEYSHLKPSVRK